ncbi:hypothetical protein [Aquimarina sp. 2201CG14-23]|uniref:hypothetical protein n=1 Tax=Aquimarina mycalae TaxID=3040073 RepID=UPI002477FF42|nr:hypothetical protein [Aquimarina sp. 2201CG14-23]MDH7445755.1 hypothetical protein [Aquimarina sp. 2201CG14-23]
MKDIKLTDILFYFAFVVVIIIAVFFDKKYLAYALPVVILSIGIIYLQYIDKINFWYILSLLTMIVCDVIIYTDFVTNFGIICLLTSVYFVACTLALRKYILIKDIKRKTFWTVPIVVSAALICYLIYSISQLLIDVVIEIIPQVTLCILSTTLYVLTAYLIYIHDRYKEGLKLIVVAFLCIFIVSLLPINELFYPNKIFTVFINIAHVLSLYIFMKFLIETHEEKVTTNKEKYL